VEAGGYRPAAGAAVPRGSARGAAKGRVPLRLQPSAQVGLYNKLKSVDP
jgi:hypothetical protein